MQLGSFRGSNVFEGFHHFNLPGRVDGKWKQPVKFHRRRGLDGSKAQALIWHMLLNDEGPTWDY